jgi:hypothetical protein
MPMSSRADRTGALSAAERSLMSNRREKWLLETRRSIQVLFAATALAFTGCTFARYSKVTVQVVDGQTSTGISDAQVRTYYVKPMMDMTYQRKDTKKTGARGFATLTVATNWSQRMVLGWTYGIIPRFAVQANGYRKRDVGIASENLTGTQPLVIRLEHME